MGRSFVATCLLILAIGSTDIRMGVWYFLMPFEVWVAVALIIDVARDQGRK